MDPRSAAHILQQIAAYLELKGESKFKVGAYSRAARSVVTLETDDLGALDRSGQLAETKGLGPATLGVLRDLIETGESSYLDKLRADLPEGLVELLDVPGLAVAKIHLVHSQLGVDSLDALEAAARDGRLATLKGFGPKTAERILRGIGVRRASGKRSLYGRGVADAQALVGVVRAHPDIVAAEIAGSVRRHLETTGDVDVVAACRIDPTSVARMFAGAPGARNVERGDTPSPSITFADGARLDLYCVAERDFAVALWRATGSAAHVTIVSELLEARGFTLDGDTLLDSTGARVPIASERELYDRAGLPFIPPEMREHGHEIELAARDEMPVLLETSDIRGALHCHSTYSDGTATIEAMAKAAQARGWTYIGITDHSLAAFYAGGLSVAQVRQQHREIDALNATMSGFRILKGIEADILADGSLDYGADVLARFDFVIGSIHSRFAMDRAAMTTRVLRALDDPHLTILGHPTGRLLLSRDAYGIDMDAVLEKAGAVGVAVELNADPHRLDLDWRLIPQALAYGCTIEIGPDAHSTGNLDYIATGVGVARKAGLEARHVLNARDVDHVLAFAEARRARGRG